MGRCVRTVISKKPEPMKKKLEGNIKYSNRKCQSELSPLQNPQNPVGELPEISKTKSLNPKDSIIGTEFSTIVVNNECNKNTGQKQQKAKRGKKVLRDFRLFGMSDYDIIPCTTTSFLPANTFDKKTKVQHLNTDLRSSVPFIPSVTPLKRKSDGDISYASTKRKRSLVKKCISESSLTNGKFIDNGLLTRDCLQKTFDKGDASSRADDNTPIINCSYGTPLTMFQKYNNIELTDLSFSQTSNEEDCELSSVVDGIISGLNEKHEYSSQSKCMTDPVYFKKESVVNISNDISDPSSAQSSSILKGVITFVEARNEFEDISLAVAKQLTCLGATISKTLNKKVTHVVFKDGRPSIQKKALSQGSHVVSVLWVDMCRQKNKKVEECLYPSNLVENSDNFLFPKKKRFRCMQPKNFQQEFAKSAEKLKEIFSRIKTSCIDNETSVFNAQIPKSLNGSVHKDSKLEEHTNSTTPGKVRKCPPIQKRKLFGVQESLNLPLPLKAQACAINSNDLMNISLLDIMGEKINKESKLTEEARFECKDVSQTEESREMGASSKCEIFQTANGLSNGILKECHSCGNQTFETGLNNKTKLVKNISSTSMVVEPMFESFNENLNMSKKYCSKSAVANQSKTRHSRKENLLNDNSGPISKTPVMQTDLCSQAEIVADGNEALEPTSNNQKFSKSSLSDFKLNDKKKKKKQAVKQDSGACQFAHSQKRSNLKFGQCDLVFTNISPGEEDSVRSIVCSLGGFNISETFTQKTTHVICGSKKRTLKVLFALACGCWMLSPKWVYKSLEAGFWLDEEVYECVDYFPAIRLSRMQKKKYGSTCNQNLFCDLGLIYVSPHCNPSQDKMSQLITIVGGKVTNSTQRCSLAVGSFDRGIKCPLVVPEKWILDCITTHKILPFESEVQPSNACGV